LPGIFAPLFLKKWPAGGIENEKAGIESAGRGTGHSLGFCFRAVNFPTPGIKKLGSGRFFCFGYSDLGFDFCFCILPAA
jgi:hypothetical protein